MTFKEGEFVIIKDLPAGNDYMYPPNGRIGMYYTHEMKRFAGQRARITRVEKCLHGHMYSLDLDKEVWNWTDEFLAPIEGKNEDFLTLLRKI